MDRNDIYTSLLMRHRNMIWRMCWARSGGNWELCRDLMQEVSIALWLHFGELLPDISRAEERAWVYWVTRTAINHQLRRPSVETQPLTLVHNDTLAYEDTLHSKEDIDDIMASLNPDEQRMMRLRMEGYHADEIASILGLKRDAIYQRMHRAVVKARRVLLVLILVLVLSTLAIAVVPSWRKALIENVNHKEEITMPQEQVSASTQSGVEDSRPEEIPQEEPPTAAVRVERLPDVDVKALIACVNGDCDTMPTGLEALLPEPVIVVSTRQIIVTGIYGERVSVYLKNGILVSSQVCNGFCVLNLFPDEGVSYRIQVGRRPAVILDM